MTGGDMMPTSSISIHALRKESDRIGFRTPIPLHISIHALRKESDQFADDVPVILDISIHALRKESDRMVPASPARRIYFNPRSP